MILLKLRGTFSSEYSSPRKETFIADGEASRRA